MKSPRCPKCNSSMFYGPEFSGSYYCLGCDIVQADTLELPITLRWKYNRDFQEWISFYRGLRFTMDNGNLWIAEKDPVTLNWNSVADYEQVYNAMEVIRRYL